MARFLVAMPVPSGIEDEAAAFAAVEDLIARSFDEEE